MVDPLCAASPAGRRGSSGGDAARSARARASAQLRTQAGDARWTVEPWRAGVDYVADLVRDADGTIVGVLRWPHNEVLPTGYDGVVDHAELVATEVAVLALLRAHAVPVPEVIAWHRRQDATDVSWMFLEYVRHEPVTLLTPALQRQMGRLARRIHTIMPTRLDCPDLVRDENWASYMTNRLQQRLVAASSYCDGPLPVHRIVERARAVFGARDGSARSLLHLDLRVDNLCIRDDTIVAVLDVSNALVGDPLLELARIRANGALTPSFLAGYGQPSVQTDDGTALDLYELDTVAMLTVVAREEIDDPALFDASRARVTDLCVAVSNLAPDDS